MRSYSRRKLNNRISHCAIFLALLVCGVMLFAVAQTIALSTPFPTLKQHEWVLDSGSADVAADEPDILPGATSVVAMATSRHIATAAIGPETADDEPRFVLASASVDPQVAEVPPPFKSRWSNAVPYWKDPSPIVIAPQVTRLAPPEHHAAAPSPKPEGIIGEVDRYLWEVYQRTATKADSSGDFTWKDPAAAKHRGMSLSDYVIGGMDPDFREQLYDAGHAMDAAGIKWSMLSAFRDDYRQELASGLKAHGGNSLHGGSVATGGYGHGRAVDVTNAEGEVSAVWHWIDVHGAAYGLARPMPGYDPSHIQSRSGWHEIAQHLRQARSKLADDTGVNAAEPATGSTRLSERASRTHYR
jgi:hypothetical protein